MVHAMAFALSLAIHLGLVAPYAAWSWVNVELDSPGDEGPENAPTGNDGGELAVATVPVRVSLYQEPQAPSSDAPAPAETTKESSAVTQENAPQDAAEGGDDPTGTAKKEGVRGKRPRGKKKPCEPIEEIVQLGESKWRVERDLLDWYATHLRELDKQAGVATHRGPDGKRDGARLFLPRCSILKQAGFKNRDIIHDVDGKKVYTIPQAIRAYLAIRNDRIVIVHLTRKNGEERTHKYKLK